MKKEIVKPTDTGKRKEIKKGQRIPLPRQWAKPPVKPKPKPKPKPKK